MTKMTYDKFECDIFEKKITIYFDTNTLLGLYRKSEKVIKNYSENMKKLPNQLRIPYTVSEEYEKNKERKKNESKSQLEQLIKNELIKGLEKFDDSKFDKLGVQLKNNGTQFDSKDFATLKSEFIARKQGIIDFLKKLEIQVNSEKNEIVSEFIETVMFKPENVLSPISRLEKIRYINEGCTRVQHELPPGYADAKKKTKKKDSSKLKSDDLVGYLGDYFIWSEILKDAKERSTDVLFVTNDLKEDWWDVPKKYEQLESYSPRKELLEEFTEFTDRSVEFIPFDLFIRYLERHYQKDRVWDYLVKNTDILEAQLSDEILSLADDAGRENVYSSITYDYELTAGYVAYDWNIELDYSGISLIQIEDYEKLADGAIVLDLSASVDCEGEFSLHSGFGGDIYHSEFGKFNVSDILVCVGVKISSEEIKKIEVICDKKDQLTSIDGIEITYMYIDESGDVSYKSQDGGIYF